jgi:hypothetical protein
VGIGPFVLVPETGEIGVFAHEFCHLLGLPDLYNTATGDPVVGPLCLMDEGAWNGPPGRPGSVPSHLCSAMKYFLGWLEPEEVCLGCAGAYEQSLVATPLGTSPFACRVLGNPGGADWSPSGEGTGEYFMLENRQTGHGYFESELPASGLLIWRVDESMPHNNSADRRLCEVIQADGEVFDPFYLLDTLPGEPSDFWPGSLEKRRFAPDTEPASDLGGGRFSGVVVENIEESPYRNVLADVRVGQPKKGAAYAYPNPYRPGRDSPLRIVFVPGVGPDTPETFEVEIFDLRGNLVRRLESPAELLGDGTALWDGRDDTGNRVSSGLYFYRVESTRREATGVIGVTD